MLDPMTRLEGVPSKDEAIPGMAYFAGTGPFGKTCGDCRHRGYQVQSKKERWNDDLQQFISKSYRTTKCAMFRRLAGENGPAVKADCKSCKYFEQKAKP